MAVLRAGLADLPQPVVLECLKACRLCGLCTLQLAEFATAEPSMLWYKVKLLAEGTPVSPLLGAPEVHRTIVLVCKDLIKAFIEVLRHGACI